MRIADLMLLIEDIIFHRVVSTLPAGGPQRITRLPTNRAACKNRSTGCRLERKRMDVTGAEDSQQLAGNKNNH